MASIDSKGVGFFLPGTPAIRGKSNGGSRTEAKSAVCFRPLSWAAKLGQPLSTPDLDIANTSTLVVLNTLANLEFLLLADDNTSPTNGTAKFRFVNAAPDAGALDLVAMPSNQPETTLFSAVPFKGVGGYIEVQPGAYTMNFIAAGKNVVALPPMDMVLKNLRQLQADGYHEAVLTGIHLGAYGRDFNPEVTLEDLLNRIVTHPSPTRIRLSSIEPRELTDAIIEIVANNERFCQHFHIPLQSGDDAILKRMHRPYSAEVFKKRVQKIGRGGSDHQSPDTITEGGLKTKREFFLVGPMGMLGPIFCRSGL